MHSFKKRLVVSYIALIISIGFLISIIYYIYSFTMIEEQTLHAANSFRKLTATNAQYNKEYLEPLINNFIKIKTEETALKISKLIDSKKNIKENTEIKKLATQSIFSKGIVIGYMQLVDRDRNIIFSADDQQIGKNLDKIKKDINALHNIIDKNFGIQNEFCGYYNISKEVEYLDAVRIHNTNYYLISSVIVHNYLNPILEKLHHHEEKEVKILVNDINILHDNAIKILLLVTVFILVLLFFLCFFISHWLAQKIASPIQNLQTAVNKIGNGDFDTEVEETGTIETAALAKTFNKLGGRLNHYIETLKQEINLKKQIESEFKIARKMQKVLLPEITEEFIRPEIEIYANLIPAKNVAGDHFDFSYLDKKEKTKLAIVLGDVSDKGIAASLGMAVISTLIRSIIIADNKLSPAQILTLTNNRICLKNPECIFDCLFMGILDIKTSKFTFANAGHHAALKVKANNEIEEFGLLNNPPIGVVPNTKYKEDCITLESGEAVILYTDGLSEAVSETYEEYSKKRIKEQIIKNINKTPKEICDLIFDDIIKFQDNVIYDDMTIVYLKNNI